MFMITDLFYGSLFIQLNTYHFRIFVLLKITYNYLNVGVFSCDSSDQTSDDTDARRPRLKDIHSRSDTNRTGAESLSFY